MDQFVKLKRLVLDHRLAFLAVRFLKLDRVLVRPDFALRVLLVLANRLVVLRADLRADVREALRVVLDLALNDDLRRGVRFLFLAVWRRVLDLVHLRVGMRDS